MPSPPQNISQAVNLLIFSKSGMNGSDVGHDMSTAELGGAFCHISFLNWSVLGYCKKQMPEQEERMTYERVAL